MTQMKPVHAHWIGRYYWCAQYFLLRLEGHQPDISQRQSVIKGRQVDEWLKTRPRSEGETKILEKLNQYRNPDTNEFHRDYRDWELIGDPDDFLFDFKNRIVIIREYKTIAGFNAVSTYVLGPASLQLKTYAYILQPIFKKLKWKVAGHHYVEFYTRNGIFIDRYIIPYDIDEYLKTLDYLYRLTKKQEEIIPPQRWKCKSCPLTDVCPLFPRLWPDIEEGIQT